MLTWKATPMSGIIKAGQLQGGADTLQSTAFNFEDISDKANHYLEAVRHQAARILEQAQQRAQQVEQQARQRGLQAAQQDNEQVLQQRLEDRLASLLPAVEEAISQLRQSRQEWLQQWERQTVHLAAAIAQRIVRRELAADPQISLDLVREALELAVGSGSVRLHLSPQDHQALNDQIADLAEKIHNLAPADIVADPQIAAGGCRVVTEFGCIDQRIESQLARIEEELA
jgi:flagellar assembly protein FliH